MSKIIRLIIVYMTCIHMTSADATKIHFRRTMSIQAYKIDPITHNDTWSIQTTDSPERGTKNETILSSSIIRSHITDLLVFKNCTTYVFVYKNPRAAEAPIKSIIKPGAIKAAGNNPVIIINTDGTVVITARNTYEAIKNK